MEKSHHVRTKSVATKNTNRGFRDWRESHFTAEDAEGAEKKQQISEPRMNADEKRIKIGR